MISTLLNIDTVLYNTARTYAGQKRRHGQKPAEKLQRQEHIDGSFTRYIRQNFYRYITRTPYIIVRSFLP